MTPKSIYLEKLNNLEIKPDQNQARVVDKLESIFQALVNNALQNKRWYNRWRPKKPVKGLYLWGSVGIGKTFMMDCFYEALPMKKIRIHFHQFMRKIHDDLTKIQGEKNPLRIIAKQLAEEAHVICFDEFLVSNIADAMILGELFSALFEQGITLITSSNTPPDLLYKDGLQRERFLPAIALIKANTDVIHLHTDTDYRKQHIQQAGVYYFPDDEIAKQQMESCFIHFCYGAPPSNDAVEICHRDIPVIKKAGSVIWFDFETICGKPRSQRDYLELIKNYHTIMISGVRKIDAHEKDRIVTFIYLIDILYDAHCRLIISANTKMDEIYTKGRTLEAYQRTYSRLVEMQSENYVYPGSTGEHLTGL